MQLFLASANLSRLVLRRLVSDGGRAAARRLRERLRERLSDAAVKERLLRAFGAAGKRAVHGARCECVFFAARLSCCGNCWLVSKAEGTESKY